MGLGIVSYNVLYLYFGEIDGVETFLELLYVWKIMDFLSRPTCLENLNFLTTQGDYYFIYNSYTNTNPLPYS